MGERHANQFINSCATCGLCAAVCPTNLDMGAVCKAARTIMVEQKRMPPSVHDFALRDMAFSNSDKFAWLAISRAPRVARISSSRGASWRVRRRAGNSRLRLPTGPAFRRRRADAWLPARPPTGPDGTICGMRRWLISGLSMGRWESQRSFWPVPAASSSSRHSCPTCSSFHCGRCWRSRGCRRQPLSELPRLSPFTIPVPPGAKWLCKRACVTSSAGWAMM